MPIVAGLVVVNNAVETLLDSPFFEKAHKKLGAIAIAEHVILWRTRDPEFSLRNSSQQGSVRILYDLGWVPLQHEIAISRFSQRCIEQE